MPTTRQGLSSAPIEQLIAQHIADAIATYEANLNNQNRTQNKASDSVGRVEHITRGCFYKEFLNCQPRNIDRTEGSVSLIRWFEKMESVFHVCNCAGSCQMKYATCTLLDGAMIWWNSYVKIIGLDAAYETTWEELKKMMTEDYCPRNKLQRMETELWNFSGLTKDIQGKVIASNLTKIQEAIHMLHDLMDQVVRAKVSKDANNKRNWEDDHGRNSDQQRNKRH
uniref:Retrotransposon gag domain-containing protein n=1 Tax=Tanacetum cinerariifolium TaxID=118510 RepID=A0A6L2KK38_TANCI|nr:hypothetical protein [Tanacetum cinerariifolium]